MAQKKNQSSGQLVRSNQNSQKNMQPPKKAKKKKKKTALGALGLPALGAPVAYSSPTLTNQPRVASNAKCTRIIHRELVATVSGNTTYGVTAYALNPGIAATFPWLSTVSKNYEQYMFRALRFHYVTRCSTTYTGSVLLSPEYDALDPLPTSEVNQAMMEGTVEDVPWRDQLVSFSYPDMTSMGPRKFTRPGSVGASDLKTYDVGQLFVGLAGCTDTNQIGKLWVEYDVDLYVPQNPDTVTVSTAIGAASAFYLAASPTITSGVSFRVPFDTTWYNGALITDTGNTGVFTFTTTGKFVVQLQVTFSCTVTSLGTCQLIPRKNNVAITGAGVNSDYSGAIAGSQLACMFYISMVPTDIVDVLVQVSSGGGTLSLDSNSCQIIFTTVA